MTGGPDAAGRLARSVAAEFRRRLEGEYAPRIGQCLRRLSAAQVWQRPAANCNSVGNLVLHLCGNVTQWIQVGFGGQPDARDRDGEFAADGGVTADELDARLRAVVAAACGVVDGLSADQLLATRTFQGQFEETGLGAVLHVLEHFSGHAGQIYAWTKQATGRDLNFYDL